MSARALILCVLAACIHAPAQNPLITTATERYFNVVRRNLETSATGMPADKYDYQLTAGQMTFAQWMVHAIQRNYSDCAVLRGVPTPQSEKDALGLTEKDDVTKALKASFVYCAEALKNLDDAKAVSSPQMSNALLHLVVHNNEIYGNIVGYLRVNGILPPSTAARKKK